MNIDLSEDEARLILAGLSDFGGEMGPDSEEEVCIEALRERLFSALPSLRPQQRPMAPEEVKAFLDAFCEPNEALRELKFTEAESTMTIRTGLPLPTWRDLYGGKRP